MLKINRLFMFCFVFSCISVFADQGDSRIEWRLLGPAFSEHATLDGAPIVKPASVNWDCRSRVIDSASGLKTVDCATSIIPEVRQWSQNNPAIGIERARVYDDHTDKVFISAVRDSFGDMGIMAGVARLWPAATMGSFKFNVGLSGGLWYRSVLIGYQEVKPLMLYSPYGATSYQSTTSENISILERRLVPFVFPVASITEQHTGIGVNIALAPKIKLGKYSPVPTTTLMIQTTYRF